MPLLRVQPCALAACFPFWRHVPQAAKAIETAEGVRYFKGIGEWPFIQQATISIWNSLDDVMQFAYRHKAHAQVLSKNPPKKVVRRRPLCPFYYPKRHPVKSMKKKGIVIGAGIAGIATAIRLAHKGYAVEVFEANSYPGGKLSAFSLGDYRFDAGPSLLPCPILWMNCSPSVEKIHGTISITEKRNCLSVFLGRRHPFNRL